MDDDWQSGLVRDEQGKLRQWECVAETIIQNDPRFDKLLAYAEYNSSDEMVAYRAQILLQRYYSLTMDRSSLKLCVAGAIINKLARETDEV